MRDYNSRGVLVFPLRSRSDHPINVNGGICGLKDSLEWMKNAERETQRNEKYKTGSQFTHNAIFGRGCYHWHYIYLLVAIRIICRLVAYIHEPYQIK